MLDRQQVPISFLHPRGQRDPASDMIKQIQASAGPRDWCPRPDPRSDCRWPERRAKEEQRRCVLNQSSGNVDQRWSASARSAIARPSWKHGEWTMGQVRGRGVPADSSLMASDDAYEILLDGKPTEVVELPIERILDDSPISAAMQMGRIRRWAMSPTKCFSRSST